MQYGSIKYMKHRNFQHFEWIWFRKHIFTRCKGLQFFWLFQDTLWSIFYTISDTIIGYSSRKSRICFEKAKILRSEIHKDSTWGAPHEMQNLFRVEHLRDSTRQILLVFTYTKSFNAHKLAFLFALRVYHLHKVKSYFYTYFW